MIRIDGSFGEGGGQILRTSLALSLVTGQPFTIEKIRAGRKKPGLQRQHLASVRAAAEIGGARCDGAEIGSSRLVFHPGRVASGDYHFDIGSAGSTSLVLQTVLPPLLDATGSSTLRIEGGTHNPHAPPFDFIERAFLPLVNRTGPLVAATLERYGFYPRGGGAVTVEITPAETYRGLELLQRGVVQRRTARALVANLPRHIAERECQAVAADGLWQQADCRVEELRGVSGPGNLVLLNMSSEHVVEVFAAVGEKGIRAEEVAARALREAQRYYKADVPVGEHLADQLLVPLALAALRGRVQSRFRSLAPSPHFLTNAAVIGEFLHVAVSVANEDGSSIWVEIG
jgi:RNA 3'-terminal phosphate cyclase (ATP)